jgi:hypothetical protein
MALGRGKSQTKRCMCMAGSKDNADKIVVGDGVVGTDDHEIKVEPDKGDIETQQVDFDEEGG